MALLFSFVNSASQQLYLIRWIGFNWTTWSVLAVLSLVVYWRWCKSRYVQYIDEIPGPKPVPVLGNVLHFTNLISKIDQIEFLRITHCDWVKKYGDIYRGWGFFRAIVCIASPELMEPILASQKLITKAKEYSYLSRWLGACMFLATGTRWRSRRRLLTPAFHFQILESFFDVFNEQSRSLLAELTTIAATKKTETVDVYPILTQCALDIICDSSMGRQVRNREETKNYLHSVNRIIELTMERSLRPWLDNYLLFNLTALGRENRKCVNVLHNFTNQVIQDRKKVINNNRPADEQPPNAEDDSQESPKKRLAFLDLLIEASENGDKLSDEDIREEVDTFMFAGHDTTATAMSWFLYCIARNPHEQKLCFDEVDAIFQDSDRSCSVQDAAELKYLECCIKETMRLYPSIPGVMRTITEDTKIGDYTLPAGLSVSLLFYGMHRNPRVYPDPDTFKPERFLPEQSVGRHPYAFLPFSAGPRNCIGQKYAMFELKVVLSWVLRKFQFSVADPTAPDARASGEIVLKPADGINLIISPRSIA